MKEFDELREVVARLRDPEKGCPWDLKQTSRSLVPNFIEELYEAIEAIEHDDQPHLAEELGDIMLHVVMQIRIAEEQGFFTAADVLKRICEKLIRRHPHIFGDTTETDADTVKMNWERLKRREKEKKDRSAIDGIPHSMPGLIVAQRMQEKAASVGFDWGKPQPVFDKMREEFAEFEEAWETEPQERIEEEIGDILFTVVNLARKLHIDSEAALRGSIRKFDTRFRQVEKEFANAGLDMHEQTLEQLDEVWDAVKRKQKEAIEQE